MAAKIYTIEGIGDVAVYKRKGTRRINLRIVSGQIRVTQPMWLPYAAGVKFAQSNIDWIQTQRQKQAGIVLETGTQIGKSHILVYDHDIDLRTRVTDAHIIVYLPANMQITDAKVQNATKSAIKRALKKEAEALLPDRLAYCADSYGFSYRTVRCKSMRTRWGSCNTDKEITLNIFLMMTPWELIDYVLVHELAHTKHLHHGSDFWAEVARVVPDYKVRRKKLKEIQHDIAPLQ